MELQRVVPGRRGTRAAALASLAIALMAVAALAADPPPPPGGGDADYPHGRFTGDCSECHAEKGWRPARISRRFNHARRSGFALTGAHASVSCTSCHASLDYTEQKQRKQCAACHQDPHLGEFGSECARCHTTRSFLDRAAMVSMHQMTRFPLVGAHAGLECLACHPTTAQGHLRFLATDPACRGCHTPGTVPDHGGFSDDCTLCHTTMAWRPARFDHAASGFPLTCPHRAPVTCVQCHGTPWRSNLSRDCVSCHQANYDATTSPHHATAGFSTRCAQCHDVSRCGWDFDHGALFPIASGAHSGIACATCHDVPGDYATFNCLTAGCHPSASTNSNHGDVRNYQYLSSACYSCHRNGRSGG